MTATTRTVAAVLAPLLVMGLLMSVRPVAAWSPEQERGWLFQAGPARNWTLPWNVPDDAPQVTVMAVGTSLQAGPVVDPEGNAYLAVDGQLIRLGADGTEAWRVTIGAVGNRSMVFEPQGAGEGLVFVVTADPALVRAHGAADGSLRWFKLLNSPPHGPLTQHPDGSLLFGSEDGKLRSYSNSGSKQFEAPMGSQVRLRPAVGSGGTIYAAGRGGTVKALTPAGSQIWSQVLLAEAQSSPVISGERIYMADGDGRARCFTTGGVSVYCVPLGAAVSDAAVDRSGRAVYACADGRLRSVSPGGLVEVFADTGVRDVVRAVVAIDDSGRILAAVNHQLIAYQPSGEESWRIDLPGQIADLAMPAAGLLLVSTLNGHLVTLTAESPPPPPPAFELSLSIPPPDSDDGWHNRVKRVEVLGGYGPWPDEIEVWVEMERLDVEEEGIIAPIHPLDRWFKMYYEGHWRVRPVHQWMGGTPVPGEWREMKVDWTPPEIWLETPLPEGALAPGQSLVLEAMAHDGLSGLLELVYLLDGQPVELPLELPSGSRELVVVARDRAGNARSLPLNIAVRDAWSALCLNPVLSGPDPKGHIPPWSRWVTVLLRVDKDLAQDGDPSEMRLAGVPGMLVAKLPVAKTSTMRSYLFRFPRQEIAHALALRALADPYHLTRLQRIALELEWVCGERPGSGQIEVLYRP